MKLIKVELLLDANELVEPKDINALLVAVFNDNSHLAKLIICDAVLDRPLIKKKEHKWQWYMNGTFCVKCNRSIGTDKECDY